MAKQVDFFDGAQSSTTPTIGNVDTTNLACYANDAAYEAANAGSPAEGNIYCNTTDNTIHYYNGTSWTELADDDTAQTFTNKTLDGTSATGTNTITIDADDASYDPTVSGLTATDVKAALDEIDGNVDTNTTNIGTNTTNIGTNATDIDDLETLSGSPGLTSHASFTGTTIPDSSTTKAALQALETAVEAVGGALVFAGTWDANGNSPALSSGSGTTGEFYIVDTAGTTNLDGITDWSINDWAIFDGTVWRRIDNSEVVTSVNGETGAVSLELNDMSDVITAGVGARNLLKRNFTNTDWIDFDPYDNTADNVVTGANATLNKGTNNEEQTIRVTDSGLISIDMIPASFIGNTFILWNDTGNAITLNNETGATAADQILTGTGGPITIKDGASIPLIYDTDFLVAKWRVVGGPGGGEGGVSGIITGDNSTADTTAGDWVAYADAAGTTPVDGTGGAPNITLARTETAGEILQGSGSYEITKGAFDRQGEGVSLDIAVPRYIRGQASQVSFSYQTTANFDHGSAADPVGSPSDMSVFLYDVTNSKILNTNQPGIFGGGLFKANVQIPSDCEDVRVILHVATTSALAYDFIFDRVQLDVAPNEFLKSASDWIDYTPIFTGFGTATSIDFQYRQDGSDILIRGKFTTGTNTAVEARVSLPEGYISSSAIPTIELAGIMGSGTNALAGSMYTLIEPSISYLTVGFTDGTRLALDKKLGNNFGSTQTLSLTARIPIQGLTSGVSHPAAIGLNAQAVLVARDPSGSATTAIGNWSDVVEDSLGAFNATTGEYTVKTPGDYSVSFAFAGTVGGNGVSEVRIDGTVFEQTQGPNNANGVYGGMGFLLPNLNYGQIITVSVPGKTINTATLEYNWLNIHKIGSEQQPYAPRVAYLKDVKAANTVGGTFAAGAWQTRILNTIEGDSSFVSLSSNQFVLQPGTYHIESESPAYKTERHKAKLRNISDTTDDIIGASCYAVNSGNVHNLARITGTITISSAKTFEIQHRAEFNGGGTNGFGLQSNFGVDEVYTMVKITKVL